MDGDIIIVISAVTVVNWIFGEWLWALFRVKRNDHAPRRTATATLTSFSSVLFINVLSADISAVERLVASAGAMLFCFIFFVGNFVSRRANDTGFPGLEIDIPGFDPEHRPIYSGGMILAAQVILLVIIRGIVN